jgi:CHAD domain-containing protein
MSTETEKEVDKLGPLGAPTVGNGKPFSKDADLRASLVSAFRTAIADAQAASRRPAVDEAVHELRKALRRARATVRLIADTLARDDRRDLTRALVEARQLLSASRDLAVVPVALTEVSLDDAARTAALAIVTGARDAALSVDEVRTTLADAAARVAPLADVMAAALPQSLDWGDLADGLADTYRGARKNLKKARRSRPAFHRFRKRAKELTYQLELLSDGIEGRTASLSHQLAALGDVLGSAVDVIMLRGFLEQHAAPPELLEAIDDDLDARIKAARKHARDLFDRRPRRFARRVRRAVRRDHAPPPADEPAAAPTIAQA